jgi:hypothetical protein
MLILFLPQFVHTVWSARIAWFWPIWTSITIVTAVLTAFAVGRGGIPVPSTTGKSAEAPSRQGPTSRHIWPHSGVPALILLAVFLACYIAVTLVWEDFAYYDESAFTLFTLAGHNFGPPIWPDLGRFFPLGHQEFNFVRHFTGTVVGYHIFPIAQLLALSCVLLFLDDELSTTARAALAAFVLTSTGVLYVFTGLFYPERNVVFWLACLLFCIKRFDQSMSIWWAVGASICAQIMIYYKEPAFLLLVTFAVTRLVLRARASQQAVWSRSLLRQEASGLDLCLCFSGGVFVLYYLAVMLPHVNKQYADKIAVSLPEIILFYLRLDLLAWLFVAVVLYRIYLILRQRTLPSQMWDALAVGGLAYFMTYLYLRLAAVYYLAPVDLIAVLYIGRLALLAWGPMRLRAKAAALVLVVVVLAQDVSFSALRLFERKNVIRAKVQLAGEIKAQYRSDTANPPRLFFPFAAPFGIEEFGSYLHYRGVPVEGAPDESDDRLEKVQMLSTAVTKDGPCVDFRTLICRAASQPDRGDLVIVLPEDNVSFARTAPYLDRGAMLFSYEPYPRIPHWLRPLIGRLSFAALARRELPDRWLHASVIAWR